MEQTWREQKSEGRPKRAPTGFTLVELMVTLLLAAVIVAAIYVMYTESTRAFQTERQFVEVNQQLRFAMDHLKSDIRRAGFQSTGNNMVDSARVCWTPPDTQLYAVTVQRNDGFVHEPATNKNIEPSAITLFGDFFSPSGHSFPALQIDSLGNVWMDPNDPVLSPMGEEEFTSIFRPGARWIRVVNKDEKEWYAPIDSVDYANRRITLGAVPPVTGYCLSSFGASEVNPVGWIRYRLAKDTRSVALLGEGSEARVAGKTDLIREEVTSEGLAVNGTALVIAEYAVDLQFYDFGFDLTGAGSTDAITMHSFVTEVATTDGNGILGQNNLGASPERLRFLTIKLSVRTPFEEDGFLFEERAGLFEPLLFFEVDPEMIGASRVNSAASRVDLRNLALRRLGG